MEEKEKNKVIIIGNDDEKQKLLEELQGQIEIMELEDKVSGSYLLRPRPPMPEIQELLYSHLTKKEREAKIESIRTEPKIDRNSICSCGSGKKYKKCCLITN